MKRWLVVTLLVLSVPTVMAQDKPSAGLKVDPARRQVIIDAKVAPRQLPHLDKVYPIELIAGWPHPKGKKAHEIVVSVEVMPSEVHKALEQLGLKPGKPAKGEGTKAEGPVVHVYLEVPDAAGEFKRLPLEKVLWDPKTKKAPPKMTFLFTGSVLSPRDPSKPEDKVYGADLTGSLICLFPVTDEVVLQTTWTMKEEKFLKLDVNPDVLPKVGSSVRLVLEVPSP
ncbi:MAG: YdjY domain-containing protein [Gemmataceae bacterium]|nr:YdjY domain-containing protein [Gemmataceae bacterium]MDW8241727.1 YdjY domain-containing protein [Thermogemmata sp.]